MSRMWLCLCNNAEVADMQGTSAVTYTGPPFGEHQACLDVGSFIGPKLVPMPSANPGNCGNAVERVPCSAVLSPAMTALIGSHRVKRCMPGVTEPAEDRWLCKHARGSQFGVCCEDTVGRMHVPIGGISAQVNHVAPSSDFVTDGTQTCIQRNKHYIEDTEGFAQSYRLAGWQFKSLSAVSAWGLEDPHCTVSTIAVNLLCK